MILFLGAIHVTYFYNALSDRFQLFVIHFKNMIAELYGGGFKKQSFRIEYLKSFDIIRNDCVDC